MVVVAVALGMGLGWWRDRSRLNSLYEDERASGFKLAMRLIPFETFTEGIKRIDTIYEAAKQSPPSPEEAVEILHYVQHSDDFRIRVRAMAVFPYLNEREEAINVLLQALRERTGERCADGVIPQYSVRYLAEMKATRAVPEINAWLQFLKEEEPYDDSTRPVLIKSGEKWLAELTTRTD
jgi:hypothetical protein